MKNFENLGLETQQKNTNMWKAQIALGLNSPSQSGFVDGFESSPRYSPTTLSLLLPIGSSNDLAIKGLGMKRSKVLGQVLKGVPVWKLGVETKFPNMPYIIFPGNVGDNNALYQLTKLLK